MKWETTRDYRWAITKLHQIFRNYGVDEQQVVFVTDRELALMTALLEIFPSAKALLCRWHINKNSFSRQSAAFQTQESFDEFIKAWNAVVNSSSEQEYNENLAEIQGKAPAHVMHYIGTTWLIYKEKFVNVWMRNVLNLGHTSTSRVESAHAALKKWIAVSTGNFLSFFALRLNYRPTQIRRSFGRRGSHQASL